MNGRSGTWMLVAVFGLIMAAGLPPRAQACPGCNPTCDTFCDEVAAMDVAVIARLVAGPVAGGDSQVELKPSRFEVTRVLKGERLARVGDKFEALLLGGGKVGDQFLLLGIARPQMLWSTPRAFSNRSVEYLARLTLLPGNSIERYRFVLNYLEDEDKDLAGDAYNEFAKAPYQVVRSMKDDLRHDEIVARLNDPNVPATRRRLYFVMLGIVGTDRDLPLLEEMLQSGDREQRRGLDMIVFSYLSIRGESGLAKIEEWFLRNEKCDFSDSYAAVMALRMHVAEGTLTARQVAGPLRSVLARPQIADLVIPDLARWEDWGAMDQVFGLYKSADEKSNWVRVPVVNYLRACPLPRAKELLAECEKIDPDAFRRAHAFFPSVTPPPAEKGAQNTVPHPSRPLFVSTDASASPASFTAPVPEPDSEPAARPIPPQAAAKGASTEAATAILASVNPGAAPAKALKAGASPQPNLWLLLGVPILSGAALWMLQSSILRGRIGRG